MIRGLVKWLSKEKMAEPKKGAPKVPEELASRSWVG